MPHEPSSVETYGRDFPAGAVVGVRVRPDDHVFVLRGLADDAELVHRFDSDSRGAT